MHRVCTISSGKWGGEKKEEEQEGIKRRGEERVEPAATHTHVSPVRDDA